MKRSIILLLLLLGISSIMSINSKPIMKNPDFAYPQKIIQSSDSAISNALKANDSQELISALVQYTIAKASISMDNFPSLINKIDSIISIEKNITSKQILYSFEAQLYASYYEVNNITYEFRTLSTDTLPKDVTEWSKTQILNKISELFMKSLENADVTSKVPVSDYNKILIYNEYGTTLCPTIYDFLVNRALDLISVDSNLNRNNLIDSQIEKNKNNIPITIYYKLQKSESSFNSLMKLYDEYSTNQYSGLILQKVPAYGLNKTDLSRLYSALTSFMKEYPKYPFMNQIMNMFNTITRESIIVKNSGSLSTGDSIKCNIVVSNIKDFTLTLYKLPAIFNGNKVPPLYELSKIATIDYSAPEKNLPFIDDSIELSFNPLEYGRYTIVASYSKNGKIIFDQPSSYFTVSDIKLFSVNANNSNYTQVFAVNSSKGNPLKDVNITTSDDGLPTNKYKTNKDGEIKFINKSNYFSIRASKDNDKYSNPLFSYGYSSNRNEGPSTDVEIFTDLGVYKPGETLNFVAIAYKTDKDQKILLTNHTYKAYLLNVNEDVASDTLSLTSDQYGRISGKFVIPKNGLNGTYSIYIEDQEDDYWNKEIEVASYKLPTFIVKFNNLPKSFEASAKTIKITGSVETYSGVPLINTDVELKLSKTMWFPLWRFNNIDSSDYIDTFNVKTDANGAFTLEISAPSIKQEDKENFFFFPLYNINASVTSLSGETQSADGAFTIGVYSNLRFTDNSNLEISSPVILPVIYESDDNTPKECQYELFNTQNDLIQKGNFIPKETLINFSSIKSGKYKLSVNILGDTIKQVKNLILYKNSDKVCPISSALWVPVDQYQQTENGNVKILVGSNTPSYIYFISYTKNNVIDSKWIKLEKGNNWIPVNAPKDLDSNMTIELLTVKDQISHKSSITILPYKKPKTLNVTVESFRDKIISGTTETWKLKFTDQNGKPLEAAMIINIYNKAIESIAENDFDFYTMALNSLNILFLDNYSRNFYESLAGSVKNTYPVELIKMPKLNMYDEYLFSSNRRFKIIQYKGEIQNNVMDDQAPMALEGTVSGIALSKNELSEKKIASALSNVELRSGATNVALWDPLLQSDSNGNLSIIFKAPNFNTTWLFRTISYTKDLLIDNGTKEFVSQKPLMVQPNLPRFLRQGDNASINALVTNSSDSTINCVAQVELFNPENNKIILSKNFNLTLAKNEQKNCEILWDVPDSTAVIGYRIKAVTDMFSDGEQNVIPILTNISPVIESQPFYLNPKQATLELPIMKLPNNANVTFEYCNNPTWYCVTALPSLFNTSAITAPGLAHTLYSIFTAEGVAKMDPQIKEAISYWKQNTKDSTLISMLERNPALKIGELSNSPWLKVAQKQTLQMQSISQLYDSTYIENVKNKTIESLKALQQNDGGWSWYKNCNSSYSVTGEILQLLGELNQLGYLNNETEVKDMIRDGVKYLDNEVINIYNRQTNPKSYYAFCYYAYVRSFFPEIERSSLLQTLSTKAIKIIAKEWKRYNLSDKAYAAILLNREGQHQVAVDIVKSIKEFSISTKNRGTYWDNLQVGYYQSFDKVTSTSLMLQAIKLINPTDPIIDSVRQWILLQKQTNNWGNSSLATDAIYTLLSTGTQWLGTSSQPQIKVGNEVVKFDELEKYTGYGIKTIPTPTDGSCISIQRTGNSPAWGSLFAQYSAPMTDIKAFGTEDISITKTLFDINGNKLMNLDNFKVGDKVKVMLTVKNKQDLNFVTIKDERCGTMEPVNQLSGYEWNNNLGYYLETKDSETNFFIYDLPKGTHLIYYDVTITSDGSYNLGIATIQCQYSPQFTAHSAGSIVTVK